MIAAYQKKKEDPFTLVYVSGRNEEIKPPTEVKMTLGGLAAHGETVFGQEFERKDGTWQPVPTEPTV